MHAKGSGDIKAFRFESQAPASGRNSEFPSLGTGYHSASRHLPAASEGDLAPSGRRQNNLMRRQREGRGAGQTPITITAGSGKCSYSAKAMRHRQWQAHGTATMALARAAEGNNSLSSPAA